MDRDIGLIYANARYLDPDTGRFLSFDPFAGYDDKPISLHRYLYAYQNPLRYVDPDGREAEPLWQWRLNEHTDVAPPLGTRDTGNQALDYALATVDSAENLARLTVNAASLVLNTGTFAWSAVGDRTFEQAEQDIMVATMMVHPALGASYAGATLKPFRAFKKTNSTLEVVENPLSAQSRTVPHTTVDDLPDVSDAMARADSIAADVTNSAIDELASSSGPISVRPLNPSTRFYVSAEGEVLDAKTYARNSGFRKGVRDEAWNDAINPETGLVNDPLTGSTMNKSEPWDMGHREGMEYWKERDNAINKWLDNRDYTTRTEFLDKMNDPKRYRPEIPSSNRSHRGEDATNSFWE